MYKNFLNVMKEKGITYKQIASILGCKYQTISDTVNGITKKGFYYEDAVKIREAFFPEYDMSFLYARFVNVA